MNLYTVLFIDSDNEMMTAKTVANNKIEAKSHINMAFDVVEVLSVEEF